MCVLAVKKLLAKTVSFILLWINIDLTNYETLGVEVTIISNGYTGATGGYSLWKKEQLDVSQLFLDICIIIIWKMIRD